jgi:stage II sporulation protein D
VRWRLRELAVAAGRRLERARFAEPGVRVEEYADCEIRVSAGTRGAQVLELPIEEYVVGAVSGETAADWADEARKAQAVACRSVALERVTQPRLRRYDLTAGARDQFFVRPSLASDRVRACVASTRGEYLTTDSVDGQPVAVRALFHTSCGGGTDAPSSVWKASRIALESVDCVHCPRSPVRWTAIVEPGELLVAVGLQPDHSGSVRIKVAERTPSGRLSLVRISSTTESVAVSTEALRSALGYEKVRSARFTWNLSPDEVRLDGVGSGHGVGMCQRGALGMAADGSSYTEILAHYYPGLRLARTSSRGELRPRD